MDEPEKKQSVESMVLEREKRPLPELPCGLADGEMRAWPLAVKQQSMPPVGAIVTAGPIQAPNGNWVLIPFRVTYRNAAKLRISCELINKLIPVPPPEPPKPKAEDPSGRTTLDVQSGVLGSKSKF